MKIEFDSWNEAFNFWGMLRDEIRKNGYISRKTVKQLFNYLIIDPNDRCVGWHNTSDVSYGTTIPGHFAVCMSPPQSLTVMECIKEMDPDENLNVIPKLYQSDAWLRMRKSILSINSNKITECADGRIKWEHLYDEKPIGQLMSCYADTDGIFTKYCINDIETTKELYKGFVNYLYGSRKEGNAMQIKRVIFNDPATIVFWKDGTKTVVKCGKNDIFDPEKGLAMAVVKKVYGNEGNYYNKIKKWLPDDYVQEHA